MVTPQVPCGHQNFDYSLLLPLCFNQDSILALVRPLQSKCIGLGQSPAEGSSWGTMGFEYDVAFRYPQDFKLQSWGQLCGAPG